MLIIFLVNKLKINLKRILSKKKKKLDNMIPDEKIEKMYDEFNGVKHKPYTKVYYPH